MIIKGDLRYRPSRRQQIKSRGWRNARFLERLPLGGGHGDFVVLSTSCYALPEVQIRPEEYSELKMPFSDLPEGEYGYLEWGSNQGQP